MKSHMKLSILMLFLALFLILSGCTAIEKSPVLHVTVNVTGNGTAFAYTATDAHIDMEMLSKLKVPNYDQNGNPPHLAMLAFANNNKISYVSTTDYHGNGTYNFTIAIMEGRVPKYNDTMLFNMRLYNETYDHVGQMYMSTRWRWNESE